MTHPPRYALERVPFAGRQVLCITIDELDVAAKPCFITAKGMVGGAYKRVDDKDIRLSPVEVYELQNMTVSARSDREPVDGTNVENLNPDMIDAFLDEKKARGSKAVRGETLKEAQLCNLGVLTADGSVRLAGLLCFGMYPQGFFPKLTVDVAVFPDVEKSAPGKVRFLDRTVCEGSIVEVVDEACAAVVRNLRTASYVEGLGRRDVPEIPREVLREAITNAVVHREYASQFIGQAVSVEVYPNRIEVLSPGGLWGGKTLENLSDGTSRCRNDLLMALVASTSTGFRVGAPAEGQGSGIEMMRRELVAHGLPAPEFEADFDYFRVRFKRLAPGEVPAVNTEQYRRVKLTNRHRDVLSLFNGDMLCELSAREIADSLGISIANARTRIRNLVEEDELIPTAPPTDRNRRYRLSRR